MTITLEKRTVYGNDLYYPKSYVVELETLTKQKTLSLHHIKALKAMGFTFELEQSLLTV